MKWRIKVKRQGKNKFNLTSIRRQYYNESRLIMEEDGRENMKGRVKLQRDEHFPTTKKQTYVQRAANSDNKITETNQLLTTFDDYENDEPGFFLLSSTPVATTNIANIVTTSSAAKLFQPVVHPHGSSPYGDSEAEEASTPFHSFEANKVNTSVRISKDFSISSGVASVVSSDFSDDIMLTSGDYFAYNDKYETIIRLPAHRSASFNQKPFVEKATQKEFEKHVTVLEDKSTQTDFCVVCTCECSCAKIQNDLNSPSTNTSIDSSPELVRRDSGVSSISGTSNRSLVSLRYPKLFLNLNDENKTVTSEISKKNTDENNNFDSVDVIIHNKSHNPRYQYNEEKERLLSQIKKSTFDPKKELYLIELKQNLLKDRLDQLDSRTRKPWYPIRKFPQSVLKRSCINNISTNLNLALPPTTSLKPLQVRTNDFIDIITQVKQCLEIVKRHNSWNKPKTILQGEFKVHRKIKLKSYKQRNEEIMNTKEKETFHSKSASNDANCFPCIKRSKRYNEENEDSLYQSLQNKDKLHACAVTGNIRGMLQLMQAEEINVNEVDDYGLPPIHYAFKNKHFRTAILLMEAGANIKDYTQKRVNEYKNITDMAKNNNIEMT